MGLYILLNHTSGKPCDKTRLLMHHILDWTSLLDLQTTVELANMHSPTNGFQNDGREGSLDGVMRTSPTGQSIVMFR